MHSLILITAIKTTPVTRRPHPHRLRLMLATTTSHRVSVVYAVHYRNVDKSVPRCPLTFSRPFLVQVHWAEKNRTQTFEHQYKKESGTRALLRNCVRYARSMRWCDVLTHVAQHQFDDTPPVACLVMYRATAELKSTDIVKSETLSGTVDALPLNTTLVSSLCNMSSCLN